MKKRVLLLLIFLGIPLVCQAASVDVKALKESMGTLAGQVMDEAGKPLANGVVSFFDTKMGTPPMVANMHRVPEMVGRMGPDGRFSTKMLQGTYYMGAMPITKQGRGPGPPQEGEDFYYIRETKGELRIFTVLAKETNKAGQVIAAKVETFPMTKNLVTIKGRLIREDGTPFVGGVVLVKTDMRRPRPDFVSPRTGADGSFTLGLPAGTPYYLLGRERVVGMPVPGTFVGTYGSKEPISEGGALPVGPRQSARPASGLPQLVGIEVGPGDEPPATITGKAGETISGIDIMMFKMPEPGAQREQLQGTLGFGEQAKEGETGEAKPAEAAPAMEK